ncbi:MAG: hypothetical protein IPK12_22905 [Gemmatimonadetes bacterium]|nr:hypothetical protein [Gemmatimonadota bacterium]
MRNTLRFAILAALFVSAACGGGDSSGPSDPVPTSLAISGGNNQTATVGTAVAVAPAVLVKDQRGNGIPGITVTFQVASGGGAVTGAQATTDQGGVARVGSWVLGTATGANTLNAAVTGLTAVTFTATATPGAPAALFFVTPPSGTASSGTAFAQQPVLQLKDVFGNNATTAGVQVTAAIATGGGTLLGTATVASNASGVVTFTGLGLTGAVGARTLSFTATGLPALTSGAIQLGAGAAASVAAVGAPP